MILVQLNHCCASVARSVSCFPNLTKYFWDALIPLTLSLSYLSMKINHDWGVVTDDTARKKTLRTLLGQ